MADGAGPIVLKLYVSGDMPRSELAIRRLQDICSNADCDVEVIDVTASPARAEAAQILATPTLVRESPPPPRRVVGDLRDTAVVMHLLEIGRR